jgi:hypothetical protein
MKHEASGPNAKSIDSKPTHPSPRLKPFSVAHSHQVALNYQPIFNLYPE